MSERLFRFKQFSVSHSAAAMKVGTDGVTLGAWATVRPGDSVLDVGAGCGLIGLMTAQRGAGQVTLLEIDPAAATEAAANATASPWADRCATVCADFEQWQPAERFTRIVSNPPFFNEGGASPNAARALARNGSDSLLSSLLHRAPELLAPDGTLSIIVPAYKRSMLAAPGLVMTRSVWLPTKPGAEPRRLLAEFSLTGAEAPTSTLILNSDEYLQLVSPFYLYV